ncbi:hypothetical protein [Variovorax sp. MHTC-1]|uniref:hypothetical protein n=1 Tax=Variovorax sp. MHTC-1 TaxID=2495593 RepID=UPI000F879B1B|nr:hypothetical protein [Variovorax sp. MHTC-1]RST56608.1 hypothetical protein EJI01_01880 [Variovorax sp. MHTC-1]
MRRALAGICLAALSVPPGASLVAAEADKASSAKMDQAAGGYIEGDESSSASLGGAIYSPFSTAFDTAGAKPRVYATPSRQNGDEGSAGLVTTTIATFVALGLLLSLVRFLIVG